MLRSRALRPHGRLARAATTAITCARILRGRVYATGGWRIVRAYYRLTIAGILLRGAARSARGVTRVAGWRVHFWGYRDLARHFKSKFIGLEYWFQTEVPRPFIIDCGANIGIATLYFKTLYPDADIIAFEPHPWSFGALEKNVRDNRLAGVQVHHAAVGGADGTAPLYAGPADPGSGQASLFAEGRDPLQVVNVVRVSRYIDRPVDFLKIDVEGAELDVLRELAQSGKLALVREMVIEYHHHAVPNEDKLSELFRVLEDHGFGYFVGLPTERPYGRAVYQDILVHAYAKVATGDMNAQRAGGMNAAPTGNSRT